MKMEVEIIIIMIYDMNLKKKIDIKNKKSVLQVISEMVDSGELSYNESGQLQIKKVSK